MLMSEADKKNKNPRVSDDVLIEALQTAARDLGTKKLSSDTYDLWRKNNSPQSPSSSVIRKWLGPWAQAVARAGLTTTRRMTWQGAPRTNKELLQGLKVAARFYRSKTLSASQYNHFCQENLNQYPLSGSFAHRFSSWTEALRQAGLQGGRRVSREDIVKAVRSAHKFYGGGNLTSDAYNLWHKKGPSKSPSKPLIYRRMGSWQEALEAAGLPANDFGGHQYKDRGVGWRAQEIDELTRARLEKFLVGRDKWPTGREFMEAGEGSLLRAVQKSGISAWADEFGFTYVGRNSK